MVANQTISPSSVSESATPSADSFRASEGDSFSQTKPNGIHSALNIVEAKIPRRKWMMKGRYAGKFVTLTYSPGGVGKSALTMLEAVAVATGRNLTGFEIAKKQAVWIYNLEDSKEEIKCRIMAIAKHYKIPKEELSQIYYSSRDDKPLILTKSVKNGVEPNRELIQWLIKELKERGVGLLVIDPLIRSHEGDENSNKQMDKLIQALQRVAIAAECSISIVHHTAKKGNNSKGGTDDTERARGASAVFDGVRIAHFLDEATPKERLDYGMEEGAQYISLHNTKGNIFKKDTEAKWYRYKNVVLENGEEVGVLELANLENKNAGKAREDREKSRSAIALVLCRAIETGAELTITDVMESLKKDREAWKAFDRYTNPRVADRRLQDLLNTPLCFDGKRFSIVIYPKKRPRFFIKCEKIA